VNDPIISISGSSIAVFDGTDLVRAFEPFTDEAQAVAQAKAFVAERTSTEPRIVRPRITKLVMQS